MPKKAVNAEKDVVTIDPIVSRRVCITIAGISPLLCNAMPPRIIESLNRKAEGLGTKKDALVRWEEKVRMEGKRFLFPTVGMFRALISAAITFGAKKGMGKKLTGTLVFPEEYVVIEAPNPPTRDVRCAVNAKGQAIGVPRPRFDQWSMSFVVDFVPEFVTLDELIQHFQQAGFSIGLGSFRVEKRGMFGRFRVDSVQHVAV